MNWLVKLVLISTLLLLGLYSFAEPWYLRAVFAVAASILMAYLMQMALEPRRQLGQQQLEIDRLNQVSEELDQNTRLIIQTDLELTRTQEELDKKISGLYTLHELSKKLIAVQSISTLLNLITEALVDKLGFEKALAVLVNPETGATEAKASLGYSKEETEGLNWSLIQEQFKKQVESSGQLLLNTSDGKSDSNALQKACGVTSLGATQLLLKDQPAGFLIAGSNPPYDVLTQGDVDLMVTLASETTVAVDNIHLYEELRKSHQELEERVKRRTQELAQANEELRRLNKMKSDFVSAVSHELRTPLTSIKGYASILTTGKLGNVTDAQRERLAKIDRHTNYLTSLISELLDIARIESGRVGMEFKQVSLKTILDGTFDLVAPQLKEKEIRHKVAAPARLVKIQADGRYLERVFMNLVSNALKFTPKGGKIEAIVTPESDHLLVTVKDSGAGISPEDLPKVFEEFYRADNAVNRERKGTGLGLSLVKRIIEAHGGRIWAESIMGKGTSFHLTLPVVHPEGLKQVDVF